MSGLVTVRWLQPPRLHGEVESVARDRIRHHGELAAGAEVRVWNRRSYYRAEIIDERIPNTPLTVAASSPPSYVRTSTPAQADHQLLLPTVSPVLHSSFQPSPIGVPASSTSDDTTDSALVPDSPDARSQSYSTDTPPSFVELYHPRDPSHADRLQQPSSGYDSDSDSGESDGDVETYLPATSVLNTPGNAQQQTGTHDTSFLHLPPLSPPVIPRSTDETHECVDEELLDDIVLSAEESRPGLEDPRLNPMQRFRLFLLVNMNRVGLELMPRLKSVVADLREEDQPCPRCIYNVEHAMERLEFIVANLEGFFRVANRMLVLATEE
ncbi:uncharacterized protein [Diadema setosum]|uniref:uncharacterized protein n=1 Tax=Diadema setosum TaxID=31175 RepID=UPI003B3AC094